MTSLLVPGYTLTLGTQRWTSQALAIDLELAAAPMVDVLTVRFPSAAPLASAAGDPAALAIDSGERAADVFTGVVESVRRTPAETVVTALDAGGALARLRPAVTFEQISAGNLVRELCAEAGVETGDIEDGQALAFYVADPGRSALDHIARVCAWSGAMAKVTADNRLEAPVVNATEPDLALRYGRELLAISQAVHPRHVAGFTVAGESGAGDPAAPEALRLTTDFFAGRRPPGPAGDQRWRSEPALRTAEAAGRATAATQRRYTASRERGSLRAFVLPALRPGTIVQVQDLPAGIAGGPLCIHHVRHRLRGDGAVTEAWFVKGGDAFDPLALLGSLAGAVGGLL
jgi:hypothetical protein